MDIGAAAHFGLDLVVVEDMLVLMMDIVTIGHAAALHLVDGSLYGIDMDLWGYYGEELLVVCMVAMGV